MYVGEVDILITFLLYKRSIHLHFYAYLIEINMYLLKGHCNEINLLKHLSIFISDATELLVNLRDR